MLDESNMPDRFLSRYESVEEVFDTLNFTIEDFVTHFSDFIIEHGEELGLNDY